MVKVWKSVLCYGSSISLFWYGWHRRIRRKPLNNPLIGPYFSIACSVYSEHVGYITHVPFMGNKKRIKPWSGEKILRYKCIIKIRKVENGLLFKFFTLFLFFQIKKPLYFCKNNVFRQLFTSFLD